MWDSGKILGNISNIHKISNIEISKKDVINNFNNLSKKMVIIILLICILNVFYIFNEKNFIKMS